MKRAEHGIDGTQRRFNDGAWCDATMAQMLVRWRDRHGAGVGFGRLYDVDNTMRVSSRVAELRWAWARLQRAASMANNADERGSTTQAWAYRMAQQQGLGKGRVRCRQGIGGEHWGARRTALAENYGGLEQQGEWRFGVGNFLGRRQREGESRRGGSVMGSIYRRGRESRPLQHVIDRNGSLNAPLMETAVTGERMRSAWGGSQPIRKARGRAGVEEARICASVGGEAKGAEEADADDWTTDDCSIPSCVSWFSEEEKAYMWAPHVIEKGREKNMGPHA